jgi:hypothetical protein
MNAIGISKPVRKDRPYFFTRFWNEYFSLRRNIIIMHRTAERVRQQLLGGRRHERVRPAQHRLTEIGGAGDRCAIGQFSF